MKEPVIFHPKIRWILLACYKNSFSWFLYKCSSGCLAE